MLGIIGGLVIGMLPGLGPLMSIVVLQGAFHLEPIPAMAMLIAVYVGGSAGGSISAILLHIPSTPLAAATLCDGYPLAQKRRSQDAIGLSITATSPGGLVAGIMLIFFSPVLADLALNFAPPKYARHGTARPADHRRGLRGLGHQGHACGRLGLAVATVGTDEFTQAYRYTFGTINLTSAPNLVTVLGGASPSRSFFRAGRGRQLLRPAADPEAADLVPRPPPDREPPLNVVRSALLGTGLGAGCDVSAFVAYAVAKRLAAAEEGYGKGAEGGVVAFEQRPELAAQVGRLAPRRGAEGHLEERPRLHRVLPHKRIAVRRRHAVPLARHLMRGPAVTSEKRVTALPEVPTVKEHCVDMVYTSWHGIMAPKGNDPEIIAAVNRALDEILTRPDIRERFGALNAGLVGSCPVAVTAFVTEQAGALSELIEMSGDSRNRARTGAPDDPAPAFHERTDYPRWMMSDQPHVLFVTVDQWPAHLLGCMGHPDIETPTLDMLERSDTLYRNCYAETPISIPSRRSMMTGLNARGHGNRDFQTALRMSAKAQTLAGAFSAAGYQTGAIGKLHANPPRDRIGFDDALLAEEGRGNLGAPDD